VPVPELSPVEEQIVLMVSDGQSHEAIAGELGVSVRTVDWHLDRARRKLELVVTLRDRVHTASEPTERCKNAEPTADLATGPTRKGDQS
jgi:DNA-binding NarL/FixJ family response regulator